MTIEVRKVGKVTILDVTGKMTIGAGDVELRDNFKAQLEAGARLFLFNFEKVPYMDSAAIGETAACAKRAHEIGGVIKIVLVPKGKADEVLRIAWLDRVFEIFGSEEEAIASFIQ